MSSRSLRIALITMALAVATYGYWGYAYGVWPQPGLLEYVLRLNGSLTGDWMMSLTPPHWALANLLGLGPNATVEWAVLALWIVGLVSLWLGVVTIAVRLGATDLAAFGSGLLLIPTSLAAVGGSQALSPFLYPSNLAFAIATLGLALVLCGHPGTAGLAMGLATAMHPNLGALATLAVLPGVAFGTARIRDIARYCIGFAVLGAVPLAVLVAKLDRGVVAADEQYDLVVRVRNPHHQLYETFTRTEFAQTALWLLVLCVSLIALRRDLVAQRVAAVATATVAFAGLGALASIAGHPRTLVMVQTARITPLVVVLGATTAAAAACRFQREAAAPLLVFAFVAASGSRLRSEVGMSAAEAVAVLGVLGITWCLRGLVARSIADAAKVAAAVSICAAAVIGFTHPRTAGSLSEHDQAWRNVAAAATRSSDAGDLFLVPPDQDGFRFYSHRPIVIDFGSFPFGRGLDEWRDRLVDVTGTRRVVDPELGSAHRRVAFMAAAYDTTVRRARLPVCRYGVKYVVTRAAPRSVNPAWLRRLYGNAEFTLYRVRSGAC